MKKFIAMLLVAMMALSLVACGNDPAPTPDPEPTASTYKTGLGMVVSMSGTDAEDEDPAKTQADVTVCEATFDQDGKIVAISFDVVQAKATVDADGVVTVAEDVKTKSELGDDYNMKKYANPAAVGEWYEQAAALEAYCIGKTAAEVAAMELGPNAHDHTDTPAVEELKSTCTISVTAFLNALTKAYDNATTEYTGYAKAGLGMVTNMSGTDAEDEDPAKTQADVTAVGRILGQGGFHQLHEVFLSGIAARARGDLKDHGGFFLRGGLHDALHDFHVVDVERAHSIPARISGGEHFLRPDKRHGFLLHHVRYDTARTVRAWDEMGRRTGMPVRPACLLYRRPPWDPAGMRAGGTAAGQPQRSNSLYKKKPQREMTLGLLWKNS